MHQAEHFSIVIVYLKEKCQSWIKNSSDHKDFVQKCVSGDPEELWVLVPLDPTNFPHP